jgi:hypothetical protein
MDQQLICELNLALIPETELASRHITFSKHMAGRYPSLIRLNGVTPRVAFTARTEPAPSDWQRCPLQPDQLRRGRHGSRAAGADHPDRLRRAHPATRHRGGTSTQQERLTPPHKTPTVGAVDPDEEPFHGQDQGLPG